MGTLDLFKNLGFSNDQLSNTFKSTGTNLSNLGFSSTNLTNNTNTGTQSAYQFNLQEPVQQKQKTSRDVLGSILKAAETNPEYAQKKMRALNYLQSDPTSSFYYPYYNPTNNAHERLAELGFDSSVINDDWWNNNKDWQNYLVYGGTTNSPTKPTKTGKSAEQYNTEMTSYWLNQLYKEKDTSAAVQKEWAAMQDELTYWTNRADLNLSDDEIVAKVNKDKKSKYPTLYKLDQSLTDPNKNLIELNEGTDYSPDNMYGVVWAARNGKTGDPIIEYTAQSGAGYGKQWEDNPEVREKLEWGNPNYSPFSVKSTMDDACCYFNKPYFTKEDIANLKVDENDATAVKMYNQLIDAEGFTEKAEEEVALVGKWLSTKLETATDPEKLMKSFDAFLDANCPNLKKMDNSMKKIDSLVDTTRPIDYSRNDVFKKVNEACAKNTGKDTFGQTMDKYGVNTGTDANKAIFAAGDQKVVEVAFSYSNGMTDSEKTYFEYAPSAHNSEYANLYRQTIDDENDLPVKTQGQVSADYVSGYIPLYTDVQTNKNAQLQLDNLNKRNEELVENCDMIRDAYRSGSSDFSFLYNIEDGETVQKGDAYVQNSRYVPALLELYERVTGESATDEDGLIRQDAVKTAKEFFDYIENGGRTYEEDEELPWIFSEFTGKRAELEKTIADTADAQSKIDNMNSELDHRIEVYDRNGIDTVELRAAKYVSEAMTYFADYEATEWTAYNKYDLMMRGEESGATFEEVKKAAVMGSIQIKKELEACLWYKEYIDENGIELPENYINNLDRHIAMLERDQEDFDYFMLQEKSDFEAGAEKGREMEKSKDIGKLDVKTIASAVADNSFGTFDAIMKGLEYSPFYDILTDEEKDTFYYLRSQDDGFIKAAEYYEHLADPTYGVLNTRNRVNIQKGAAEEVNSGILGGTWANIKAILSAPVDFLGNATYMLYAALNDKELNPDSAFRASSQYSTAVNAATVDAIHEGLKDSPVLDTLLSGMYEIAYNRGRSLVNGLTFGWLTKGIDTELIKEIIGALPMAIDAAGSAAANAKSRGAEDWQAYSIAGITAFAESVTEGLTYGNITEALYGGDQGVAVRTFKDMMINWLTSSGVEEMIGESANDIIENLGDRYILGALSEHQASVNEWIEKLGLDPNNPADVKLAEDYATKDEAAALLHTALISYLSPGLDVFTGSIRDTLSDMRNVRSITNNLKARELDISGEEIREEYKNYKHGLMNGEYKYGEGYKQEGITENQRMIRAAAEGIRNAPTDAQIEQARQEAEAQAEAEYQQRRMSDADQQFIQDLSAFDTSEKSDAVTQTAALAAIFGRTNNTQDIHLANAAAILIQKAFGGLSNAVTKVKSILNAAHQFGIDYQNVKTALEVASLSESSQAAQMVASEEFQNATPEQQAEMLASTVEGDMQNQTVMEEANTAIRENRIAEKEAKLAEEGAYDDLEDKRIYYEAEQHSLGVAEQDVEDHRREEEIKVNAALNDATNAANEMAMNPTDENRNWVDRAMGAFNKATEVMESVVKQWEEHLDKITRSVQDAKEKYENALRDKQTEVRQQAEQMVDEEDQQMAEAAAQQEEQARIEAEQAEQARLEEEENNNFARAQADELIAENYANATPEQQEKIRSIVKGIHAEKPMSESDKILARRDYVKRIGKKFGYDIRIGDTTEGGRFLYQNASVNPETGVITLSKEATLSDAMYAILGHEVTHIAERSGMYNELADALIKLEYGEDTARMQADIDARQDLYTKGLEQLRQQGKNVNPNDVTPEYAKQELVADLMGKLFLDDNGNANVEMLNRFAAESPNVATRVLNAIKNFLKKIAGIEGAPITEAQKIVDTLESALKSVNIKNAYADDSSQNVKSIASDDNGNTAAVELPGGTVAVSPTERFSLNSFNDEEVARVRQALYSAKNPDGTNRFTRKQVNDYIDNAMGIAAVIAADRNRLDFEASDNQVFLKPNNDYYFTLDASTLCAKRLLYQGTFDYVQHALPDEVFTPEDLIDLVNIMSDMGYETPCGICYVESRRRWLDTYANEFLNKLPEDADAFIDKYFKKASDDEKAYIREHYAEWKPTIDIDNLTTSDGLEKLRHDNPYMHKAFVAAMNNKGTQNPKVVQLRTEYRGDIYKNMTDRDVQKVKDIGGLRIQSFSDFETPHLLDMMQAVLDMSARGLTSQAYTKVPNFAWVFGDTGIKINLSLIGEGTGLDENGNLVFDSREGINFDEAMKLREKYGKNVGTILVGINDDHIVAAMGDPRIDFIIPFHKSGWSDKELKGIKSLNNYKDYTDTQNERVIIKQNEDGSYETESFQKHKERTSEKLENFQPVGKNGYWNFKKSGQWNAENYLKMCAEQHRIPKFSQFLVDNGDGSFSLPKGKDQRSTAIREGYWKTLIDFKMYENDSYGRTKEDGTKTKVKGSEQKEVRPNINMAEAYRVLNDYELGRQMPDQADGTKGKFIKMENNNSVPVAVPAAEQYIELIRNKRAGNKPAGPGPNVLEAELPADASAGMVNPRASAFGASQAQAVLGNTESTAEETTAQQQSAMAIDAETGETVRYSLPTQEEVDRAFEEYIENLSLEELEELAQKEFGFSLKSPSERTANATPKAMAQDAADELQGDLHELYANAIADGDTAAARKIIDKIAKAAGYTVKGTHRTNAKFTVFDKSKQSGKNGKSLGDGFYVASGEGTEYDDPSYGKNRMLVYINPGNVFNISKGLTEEQARSVYDKYFAPYHPDAWEGYTSHVIEKLQRSTGVIDYIKEAAENAGTTTDEVFKWLGYNSIKDGPQYCVFDPEQIKSADLVTYDDNWNDIKSYNRFNKGEPDIRYSLPSDAPYLSAVNHGDMDEAQALVDERAEEAGYVKAAYHGTLSGGFTVFDKAKAGIGGNSGAGFYFSSNPADSEANYSDVEGADNYFKRQHLVDNIYEQWRDSGEDTFEYDGYEIDESTDIDEIAKEILTKNPQTYHVYLDPGKAYIRDFNNSTNLVQEAIDNFDESLYDPADYADEDEYYDDMSMRRSDEIYQAISDAVYNAISDIENNYEIYSNIDIESIVNQFSEIAMDYENLTWNDLIKVLGEQYIDIGTAEMSEPTDGSHEIARAIVENFGFDSIEDREVSKKFNQLKNMGATGDTVHYVMFKPEQIKLADPVTYDNEGNVIPLSERFKKNNRDIRYSLPSDNILEQQIRKHIANASNAKPLEQEDIDAYNEKTSRPLEGRSTRWTQTEGPAQRQFATGMLQDSDEIAQQAKDYALAHNAMFPDTNESQIERAINWIRKNGSQKNDDGSYTQNTDGYSESLAKVTSKNFDYRSADGQARMVAMMGMAVAKNDVMAQVALVDAFNRQGTDLGRALQARKLFRLMTPEGRINSLQKMLDNMQDELDSKGKNVDLKFSDWIYMAAAASTEEGGFQKVQQAAAQELAEQLPANWKDRIRSLRMLSMLANPRTHIRNVLGNAFFIPAVGLKNKLGAIAELGVKEGEKTKTLSPFLSKEARRFAREDVRTMKDELTGEAKYNEDSMVQREQKAFKGLLQGLIDFNSNALEKEDWKFLKGHYIRALGGWMMANGYTESQLRSDPALLEKGRAYAVQEAQKATYRDFSKVAQKLNSFSRDGGPIGFLVDAALPFKKTPINILKRGMEYSPAGIMRSLTTDLYHLKQWNDYQDGKLNALPDKALSPTQFIDRICSGLSGSAVMALGFLLGSAGVVSVSLDDDEDELEKEKGAQKYAFKFSIGGKDFTYTVDWAAPMSMPFFVGAAIQEQVSDQDDVTIDKVFNAMANISEPVFNLSMLDGVNTLFKTSQYDDTNSITQILAKVGLNYATSFVPSALGAFTKTFVDSYRRKAFVPSDQSKGVTGTARYSLEQTENKIPGLSQTNIPYRNVWGEAETSGFVERLFENFISPGYIQEYKDDPILNEMGRLYDVTGDASMIPSDPAKSVTYEKQKYVLTAEQWDHYKEVRGQTAFEVLSALIDTDSYKNADTSTQVQMIKGAWSYADAVGKSTFIPNYEVPKMGNNPTEKIAKDATITGYKNEMIKALNANDWEAYDTMVEALRQADVEDSDIKEKLSKTYCNQWKDAYRNDDEQKMAEIEEILDNTGFSFNIYGKGGWMQKVDEENE